MPTSIFFKKAADYFNARQEVLPSHSRLQLHVEDTWENYDRMKARNAWSLAKEWSDPMFVELFAELYPRSGGQQLAGIS